MREETRHVPRRSWTRGGGGRLRRRPLDGARRVRRREAERVLGPRAGREARGLGAGPRRLRADAHLGGGGSADLRAPARARRGLGARRVKYLAEYRQREAVETLARALRRRVTRPWVVMEVCGGQTHSIVRYGVDQLLPPELELVHGPGCPVCVTPLETIDRAHAIAAEPDVVFCSYGDMLRVPGSRGDLLAHKARGADVRVVLSPLDALSIAAENPGRRVVFFAIGFETTAPANAQALLTAKRRGLDNFFALVSHVRVPPALTAILATEDNRVQAFLGPGHVCTVMGTGEYEPIAERHRVPIVITGFEPVDLLEGLLATVEQLESGRSEVEIQYRRAVTRGGNAKARELLAQVFVTCDRKWRGIGKIPQSGLELSPEYRRYDAERELSVTAIETAESPECFSGQVLCGLKKPLDCPAFGRACTPEHPLGATMVSSEGACAAYYAYGRHLPRVAE
ncbi:MAG: hydrogenase formation protein HypD [Polyangiaceae bacterium]|nr:hydrogenase formation protein HypD [Polyangiaceae bacterium]MCL4751658.1 hydrogenase formation protein HypD [Myxococcales bacterium]